MPFQALGLAEPITRALAKARYHTATPIQSAAIPVALGGRDLIGIAQTGTGKTAAFALPILHRLNAMPGRAAPKTCRVLVLAPTRELSGQIADSFSSYGRNLQLGVCVAIGGVPIGRQIRALGRGTDVLVATPGRLLDLVKSRALRLDAIEVLVLDEADRMLDMGFIHDIRRIVAMLPQARQTLFFSATMPPEIARLADEMLIDPAKVSVAPPASTVERIDQRVLHLARSDKPGVLAKLLADEPVERALVFTRTKHGADRVVRGLAKAGIAADAIHGNKSQGQREKALAAFREGKVHCLVATDIAARGIDVAGISHVVNFDLPNIPETYVHRIGRTARAGSAGVAVSLCSTDEKPHLRSIEKLIGIRIPATGNAAAEARSDTPPAKAEDKRSRGGNRGKAKTKAKSGTKPASRGRSARLRYERRHGGAPRNAARPYRGDDIGAVGFMRNPGRAAADPAG